MRSSGGVRRHSGKAAAAASTAALTSFASAMGTWASVSPVAGLTTSRHSVDGGALQRPLMKLVRRRAGGAMVVVMWCLSLSRRFVRELRGAPREGWKSIPATTFILTSNRRFDYSLRDRGPHVFSNAVAKICRRVDREPA